MSYKIGTEFIETRGCYIPVMNGKGTHVWNGKKIVPKEAEKPQEQPQAEKPKRTRAKKGQAKK